MAAKIQPGIYKVKSVKAWMLFLCQLIAHLDIEAAVEGNNGITLTDHGGKSITINSLKQNSYPDELVIDLFSVSYPDQIGLMLISQFAKMGYETGLNLSDGTLKLTNPVTSTTYFIKYKKLEKAD